MAIGSVVATAVTNGARLYSKIPTTAKKHAAHLATTAFVGRQRGATPRTNPNSSPFSEALNDVRQPKISSRVRDTAVRAFNSPLGQELRQRSAAHLGFAVAEGVRRATSPSIERMAGRAMQNPAVQFALHFFEPELARAVVTLLEPQDGPRRNFDRLRLQIMRDAVQTVAITASQYGIGNGFVPSGSDFPENHQNLNSTGYNQIPEQFRQDVSRDFDKARFEQKVEVVGAGVRSMLTHKAASMTMGTQEELNQIINALGKLSNTELGILNLENYLNTATNGFLVDEKGPMLIPAKAPAVAAHISNFSAIIEKISRDPDLSQLIQKMQNNG